AVTQIDQRAYLIGDAARRLAAPLWSRDKALDDETLRLILVGAASVGGERSGPPRHGVALSVVWGPAPGFENRLARLWRNGRLARWHPNSVMV
ncbi:hypothetical protein, partial [Sulfobacillus thermosulfidooxidans]|uniref:hypothetical protein n=1 Tax=Sulfobacillus thermosulfidooxidans TaxID=28034 RepID=UPI001A9954BC